ncbi:zinc ribbon domain-containing protein [Macrococcus sp. EM39E]|uniref:zinc ribbon domain-containing protein n=1 Tax=Macrococcus animalis TaxID=3395467 RepID=UPI0039BE61D6
MKCKNCNNNLEAGDLFCGECGTPVGQNTEKISPRVNVTSSVDTVIEEPIIKDSTTTQQTTYTETQPIINKEQVNQQSKKLVNEGKGFFSTAFKNHDQELNSNHNFSLVLASTLIGIGLLLIVLLLMIKIPSEIAYIGISKSSIIFKVLLSSLAFIALIIGITFTIVKFMINPVITISKVISDFVLINVFSFITIMIGLILIVIDSFSFGGGLTTLGVFILATSPIFMIGKYSNNTQTKISSFYGVIIYMIILAIVLRIFGESTIGMLQGIFTNSINNAAEGLFNNY